MFNHLVSTSGSIAILQTSTTLVNHLVALNGHLNIVTH